MVDVIFLYDHNKDCADSALCIKSLLNTLKGSQFQSYTRLSIFHTDPGILGCLTGEFADLSFPAQGVRCEDLEKQSLEWAKNSEANLFFFIQNGFIHHPKMYDECLESYLMFSQNVGEQNDALVSSVGYTEEEMEAYTVMGSKRHWRTNKWMGKCYLTSKRVISKDTFPENPGATVFTPLPSLSYDLQSEPGQIPFVDVEEWK